MNLQEIQTAVHSQHERNLDLTMNLQSAIPLVEDSQPILKIGHKTQKKFTRTGLQSYLQKIDVPIGFFNKCSDDLKRDMLGEFHEKIGSKDVLLRTTDDSIRFCASDKYAIFDDKEIVDSLVDMDFGLDIKEFHQNSDFFMLRAFSSEPIQVVDSRPYFTGVQIMNSEVGRSSVKVQLCLWEQVCTNGMVVQNRDLGGFTMIHLGKDRSSKLRFGVKAIVDQMESFTVSSAERLKEVSQQSSKHFLRLLETSSVSQGLKDRMKELLPKYSSNDSLENAKALDVISSFTEAIQSYSLDVRHSYEKLAGDYLWQAA